MTGKEFVYSFPPGKFFPTVNFSDTVNIRGEL